MNDKRLFFMRGLPGSGKSTLANKLQEYLIEHGRKAIIFSTDDIFMDKHHLRYYWHVSNLGAAHKITQEKARLALLDPEVDDVIVDNTNVDWKSIKAYVVNALDVDCTKFHLCTPDTLWAFDVEECFKKNSHSVPKESIQRMLDNWQNDATIIKNMKSMLDEKGVDYLSSSSLDNFGDGLCLSPEE